MNSPSQIALRLRQLYFGGNWTSSNVKNNLSDVTWLQATTAIYNLNTIAILVFHSNYYVNAVIKVLQEKLLNAHDKYSFDLPPILSQQDWEKLLDTAWADVEKLASLIEEFPESKLWEDMADEKYGSYYRNFNGIIEHTHYHLGQIVLLKKIIQQNESL